MRKLLLLALFAWCYDLYSQPTVVDLGLPSGTKWAKTNVGANNAQDYGNYYAWGEKSTKSDYTWVTYLYSGNTNFTLTKYCDNSEYGEGGFSDSQTVLEAADDVVNSLYGADYQIPTAAQWKELVDKCEWKWTDNYNNTSKKGYIVYKKKSNNSYSTSDTHIFLPAAGCKANKGTLNAGSYGDYWSSTLGSTYPYCAQGYFFHSGDRKILDGTRYYGRTVRPVKKP